MRVATICQPKRSSHLVHLVKQRSSWHSSPAAGGWFPVWLQLGLFPLRKDEAIHLCQGPMQDQCAVQQVQAEALPQALC